MSSKFQDQKLEILTLRENTNRKQKCASRTKLYPKYTIHQLWNNKSQCRKSSLLWITIKILRKDNTITRIHCFKSKYLLNSFSSNVNFQFQKKNSRDRQTTKKRSEKEHPQPWKVKEKVWERQWCGIPFYNLHFVNIFCQSMSLISS